MPYIIDLKAAELSLYDLVQRYFSDDGKGDGVFLLDLWLDSELGKWGPAEPPLFSNYDKSFKGGIDYFKDSFEVYRNRREIVSRLGSREVTVNKIGRYFSVAADLAKYSPGQLRNNNTSYKHEITSAIDISKNYFLDETNLASKYFSLPIAYIYRAQNEAVITVLAIMRYRNDTGSYPQTLDQLIEAGYLKYLPIDPYSNKPMKYKHTEDNFILYSLSRDFDDDGGTKEYSSEDKNGDKIYWPIPDPTKKPPVKLQTMPGMPGMGMPGMPGMPGMGMPGMMPPPEQPPMDPNMIT